MKPLILTGSDDAGLHGEAGLADIALDLAFFRFIWGPQPSPDRNCELSRPSRPRCSSGHTLVGLGWYWNQSENRQHRDLGLAEFCQQYETVELWFDMRPEAQLKLVWLLDYFSSYPEAVARLKLRLSTRR